MVLMVLMVLKEIPEGLVLLVIRDHKVTPALMEPMDQTALMVLRVMTVM